MTCGRVTPSTADATSKVKDVSENILIPLLDVKPQNIFVFVDSPGANVTQDAGILVLTILVSSILIYNSLNVPYKKDLDKLKYVFIRRNLHVELVSFQI